MMSAGEYSTFGRPFDLKVLGAASGGWLKVLHLHGQHPMLKELADYPVQAVNWHDRTSDIDLAAAAELFPGMLMGGVEQQHLLLVGSPEDVAAQARDAIVGMGSRQLMLSTVCTDSLGVSEANLMAMRRAVG